MWAEEKDTATESLEFLRDLRKLRNHFVLNNIDNNLGSNKLKLSTEADSPDDVVNKKCLDDSLQNVINFTNYVDGKVDERASGSRACQFGSYNSVRAIAAAVAAAAIAN